MSAHLFTYGTLEVPEVFAAITGRQITGFAAKLPGYARYYLQGAAYPGIVTMPGASLQGTLYLDLDATTHKKIDHYEDTCYEKRQVTVRLDDGQELTALAYVIPEDKSHLLSSRRWDRQQFIEQHLENFLRYLR
ncbi:gamma-glutamylcyclotransferase family protein [Thiohalophilus thiocyanatoxydans]|uniref:Putative gamma-glutamylcyclotransferase n=1 Tax=Thiohalophilus thiocyanatoxydans TaxID=381308 RepID=A0A4R8II77_9GAMM|nr:gamma-glutamylcyclotransferase family protein [Thiohalophilus thiocyanatoxydans]TDX97768.1 gamma-glutamyl AIG2-like cyclotransferase [Thiohalophilus thiocyanatoxydans]